MASMRHELLLAQLQHPDIPANGFVQPCPKQRRLTRLRLRQVVWFGDSPNRRPSMRSTTRRGSSPGSVEFWNSL